MAKKKIIASEDEVSMESMVNTELAVRKDEEIELISDPEIIEELSDEAKENQKRALANAREQATKIIDSKKIPIALKEIDSLEAYSDILNDSTVLARVKKNIKTARDLKDVADAQKTKLQNLKALLDMESIDTSGTAGEEFFEIKFTSGAKISYGSKK